MLVVLLRGVGITNGNRAAHIVAIRNAEGLLDAHGVESSHVEGAYNEINNKSQPHPLL